MFPGERRVFGREDAYVCLSFLISNPATGRPCLGIQLEHNDPETPDRQRLGEVVDALFAEAGLPLLRMSAQGDYVPSELAATLGAYLGPIPMTNAPCGDTDSQSPVPDGRDLSDTSMPSNVCEQCGGHLTSADGTNIEEGDLDGALAPNVYIANDCDVSGRSDGGNTIITLKGKTNA